jgi:hypothetical protein
MMARFGWTQSTDCYSTDSSGSSRQSSPRSSGHQKMQSGESEWGRVLGPLSTRSTAAVVLPGPVEVEQRTRVLC